VAVFVISYSDSFKFVDFRYSRSTVCIVSLLFEVCVSNSFVSLSMSLSHWAEMSYLPMNVHQSLLLIPEIWCLSL